MHPKIALGTYRIIDENPLHVEAIKDAIEAGVRLIDTSSNYMDGCAERAIAAAFSQLNDTLTCKVEIVSKLGYIQGSTLQRIQAGALFDEMVEFSEHVYHCIHPDFIRDQLEESLGRLHVKQIGCYLIHNPEYALLDALNREIEREAALEVLNRRLYNAFVTLEELVNEGTILSYGISSNSVAKSESDTAFLPYKHLIDLAAQAAKEVGNTQHRFTTLQLPINLLEQEGLKCASWAKAKGLRVLANRPLNAQKEGLMYRLADYDASAEYYHIYNELLELLDDDATRTLYNLIEQLDSVQHRFGWLGEYDAFLYQEILPNMARFLKPLDASAQEYLLQRLQLFLDEYGKMVANACATNTKTALKSVFEPCHESMQHCALKFLLEHDAIDYVLVGMRQSRYVVDVMNIA